MSTTMKRATKLDAKLDTKSDKHTNLSTKKKQAVKKVDTEFTVDNTELKGVTANVHTSVPTSVVNGVSTNTDSNMNSSDNVEKGKATKLTKKVARKSVVSKLVDKSVDKKPKLTKDTEVLVDVSSAEEKKSLVKKTRASKSPTKVSTKQASKSPVKRTKSVKSPPKSPTKSVKSSPKSSTKVLVKKSSKTDSMNNSKTSKLSSKVTKDDSKNVKSKRTHNIKPATMDTTGIGIGPARVKSVLMNISLNPREFAVRNAILAAENKPRKPKPTAEDPDPEMPAQGPQTPIDKLDAHSLSVIHEAEQAHENSIRESYERNKVSTMDDNTRRKYNMARKEAQNVSEEKKGTFVLQDFNTLFDKTFYDGYATHKKENDNYVTGLVFEDKDGKPYEKYNQYSRATALVNKLCIRLSGNTRNIIACFLDRIVEQYALNAIHNCLEQKRRIVQLFHALTETEGFDERVPLSTFVGTLKNYARARDWIDNCRELKKQFKQTQEVEDKVVLPEYPKPEDYSYDFGGYVGEICRSVKIRLAETMTSEAERVRVLSTSVSQEFKQFCSYVIYESILRIGSSLCLSVERQGVKTISDAMVYYVLKQIHSVCGIEYDTTNHDMSNRLNKFKEWRGSRKKERKDKRSGKKSDKKDNTTSMVDATEDATEDVADDEDTDVDVDVEAEDEAEAEANEVESDVESDGDANDANDAEVEVDNTEDKVDVKYDQE